MPDSPPDSPPGSLPDSRPDALEVARQLERLRALEDGWLEGEGTAPPADGLDRLAAGFEKYFPEELPLPRIYPTPAGGAQLEWTLGSNEIGVEVDLTTGTGEWHRVDLSSRKDEMDSLDLTTSKGWEALRNRIGRLALRS